MLGDLIAARATRTDALEPVAWPRYEPGPIFKYSPKMSNYEFFERLKPVKDRDPRFR